MKTTSDVRRLLDDYVGRVVVDTSTNGIYDQYMHTEVRFSYVSLQEKEGKLHIVKTTRWYGCRGYMCEAWHGSRASNCFSAHDKHFDVGDGIHNGLSCLLVTDIPLENLQEVVAFLNRLHKKYGWDPSFFVTVGTGKYLLVSSGKWFSSLAYLSLYLLLIRLAKHAVPKPNESVYDWMLRASKTVNCKDTTNLRNLTCKYTNFVDLMMEHQEFLTEEDDPDTIRVQYRQSYGHHAGVNDLHDTANKLHPDVYNDSLEKQRDTVFHWRCFENYSFMLHPNATLRLAVVLKEYGEPVQGETGRTR